MKKILITGSAGLIGSEVAAYFDAAGWEVHGVDNNQRAVFFGPQGDTNWNLKRMQQTLKNYHHHAIDIRDRNAVIDLIQRLRPHALVHAAAQPSHDKAAQIPFDDFDTNAVGTLNLLEASRLYNKEAPFVLMSTNKVYGDRPNSIAMHETETRYDYADDNYTLGIPETFPIDHCTHSVFGVGKVAADMMVQEYGRYFGMATVCLRGGCLTGPQHSGVQLHGFLNYLVKCHALGNTYTIFGYKGKQVRDNIHAADVAAFIAAFLEAPKAAAVYNLGGGKANAISILETFELLELLTGKPMQFTYDNTPRVGDHICYYSDLTKLHHDYPTWQLQYSVREIIEQMVKQFK